MPQLNPDLSPPCGGGGKSKEKSSKGEIKCHIITLTEQVTEQVVFLSSKSCNKVKYGWEYDQYCSPKTLWLPSGEELLKHLPSPRLVMGEMAVVR